MRFMFSRRMVTGLIGGFFFLMTACGGGGGSSNDTPSQTPAGQLTGIWEIEQTINGNCQSEDYPIVRTQTSTVTQSGNHITFSMPADIDVDGTISGSSVTWRASFPEDGGTLTNNFSGTLSGDGNRIDGSSTWSWTDGNYTCSGTAQIVLSRLDQASGDASGTWDGTWTSTTNGVSGTFRAQVIQTGNLLGGTIDVPFVGIIDTQLKGTASGTQIVFGDIDNRITFTGTRSGSSNASGTYIYPGMSDTGSWQGIKSEGPVAPAVVWQKHDMGIGVGNQSPVIIGDGRDEGVLGVYTGEGTGGSSGRITEYHYGTNGWELTNFGDIEATAITDLSHATGLAVGSGQNDGITRLYAAGYGAAQFTHDGANFAGEAIADDIQWTNSIVVGDARGDGVNRIYVGGWHSIYEMVYQGNVWVRTTIDSDDASIGPLAIADGRNDGVTRLYAATTHFNHVFEYTFVNGQWQSTDCGTKGLGRVEAMVTGDGRGDGQIRFYLASNHGVRELGFEGGRWIYTNIGDISNASAIALGAGRNDGRIFIYIAENQDALWEYAYGAGGWAKSSQIDTGLAFDGMVLGIGRSDGIKRIYATCRDGHLYEYVAAH